MAFSSSAPARNAHAIELLAHLREPIAAPEELAVDDEHRHAEDARLLRLRPDAVVLGAALAFDEGAESLGRRARLLQHRLHHVERLDIELAFPEAVEDDVVVAPEDAFPFRIEQADAGEPRI